MRRGGGPTGVRTAFAFLIGLGLASPVVARAEGVKLGGPGKKVVIERVVAVVNDTVILESELVQRSRPAMPDLEKIESPRDRQTQWKGLLRQVLGELVDEELVMQAAVEAKVEVSDGEIDRALNEVKRQNKVGDAEFKAALAQQGYSIDAYRKDVRRQMVRMRTISLVVRPRVAVTDDDVKDHYDKVVGKSSSVMQVRARHIMLALPDKPTAEQMDVARRRAGELVARARAGESFQALAKANSQDASTKAAGGELGWLKRGELPTEWEEILFGMSEGEVRGPVRGAKGLHVFLVEETKQEDVRGFDEVKEQLRSQLSAQELERQTKLWLEELRKKAHVEVKL